MATQTLVGEAKPRAATHVVFNQASPLLDYDMFSSDLVLRELVSLYGGDWAKDRLIAYGTFVGSAHGIELGIQANENPPTLHTHDRFGHRIDSVEFHPAYHELMKASIAAGVHNLAWNNPRPGAHVARAALAYMAFQNEAGHCCPVSMTFSVIPSLRKQPDVAARFERLILSDKYDPTFAPYGVKAGLTIGMGMTEKQGGSDVRANTTSAEPIAERGPGKEYLLNGHKWFCSAPMSDAFLMLAKTDKGVSCFLVPRWRPDGSKNNIFIQRLKGKLGNHSNASSEIELVDAFGWLISEEGRGVPTIIEMVNNTRLDCTIGSSALMRQSLMQAIHHCAQRSAFGKKLIEQPAMMNVLADLAIESEAAVQLTMRVAHSYDSAATDPREAQFKRIASAIAKYWTCKRGPVFVAEALECMGGNGYVEEGPMPRLYREAPLLGIWEGSGNVICLDVLRAIMKDPQTLDAVLAELDSASGKNPKLDTYVRTLKKDIAKLKTTMAKKADTDSLELAARMFVERLALALQAGLLVKNSPAYVASAFIATRLNGKGGYAFGTLPPSTNFERIIERAYSLV